MWIKKVIKLSYYTATLAEVYKKYPHQYATIARDIFSTFSYPIYDDSKKEELETDFVQEFYMSEFAHETFQMWLWRLAVVWNDTIPKYNLLWQEQKRILDKGTMELFGSGRTETYTGIGTGKNMTQGTQQSIENGETKNNSTQSGSTSNDTSDMPISAEVDITSYRSEANAITVNQTDNSIGTSTSNTDNTVNQTDNSEQMQEYERIISGNAVDDHNYSLLMEFAANWTDIQKLFFNELEKKLFMQIVHL